MRNRSPKHWFSTDLRSSRRAGSTPTLRAGSQCAQAHPNRSPSVRMRGVLVRMRRPRRLHWRSVVYDGACAVCLGCACAVCSDTSVWRPWEVGVRRQLSPSRTWDGFRASDWESPPPKQLNTFFSGWPSICGGATPPSGSAASPLDHWRWTG